MHLKTENCYLKTCMKIRVCEKMCKNTCNIMCVWIPFILLKTENNKKSFFDYCSILKLPFTCLFALFMGHEQCNMC